MRAVRAEGEGVGEVAVVAARIANSAGSLVWIGIWKCGELWIDCMTIVDEWFDRVRYQFSVR